MKKMQIWNILMCLILFLSCNKKENEMVELYKSGNRNPDLIGSWKLVREDRLGGVIYTTEDSLSVSSMQKLKFHANGNYQNFRFDDTENDLSFTKYWYNPDNISYKIYYDSNSKLYGNDEETIKYYLNNTKDTMYIPTSNTLAYYIRY